jgi:hypothetical protein
MDPAAGDGITPVARPVRPALYASPPASPRVRLGSWRRSRTPATPTWRGARGRGVGLRPGQEGGGGEREDGRGGPEQQQPPPELEQQPSPRSAVDAPPPSMCRRDRPRRRSSRVRPPPDPGAHERTRPPEMGRTSSSATSHLPPPGWSRPAAAVRRSRSGSSLASLQLGRSTTRRSGPASPHSAALLHAVHPPAEEGSLRVQDPRERRGPAGGTARRCRCSSRRPPSAGGRSTRRLLLPCFCSRSAPAATRSLPRTGRAIRPPCRRRREQGRDARAGSPPRPLLCHSCRDEGEGGRGCRVGG